MKSPIKFHRLQPGYYYSRQTITIQGITTHVVIEDRGTYWLLRLEDMPGFETTHKTKAHAIFALNDLAAGSLAYA